jgi:uncharacterized protein YacL (UPF0231 family)
MGYEFLKQRKGKLNIKKEIESEVMGRWFNLIEVITIGLKMEKVIAF